MSGRSNPASTPISSTKIAILGGKDQDEKDLGDVVLFDVRTFTCTTVNKDFKFKFTGATNQCLFKKPNDIVVLSSFAELNRTKLLNYNLESKKIKVLQEWS